MSDLPLVKQALPENSIQHIRLYDYNRQQVWNAIANADHLKIWWGPKGFTNTFHEFDFKVGGIWRYTMHGPDKGNYENEVKFIQVQPPSFVAWDRISNPKFQMQIGLDEVGAQHTELSFTMLFDTEAERDKLLKFVKDKNEENLDRLEALLNSLHAA
jgi:uncharacterized protein YndB with AHSA1/START domain